MLTCIACSKQQHRQLEDGSLPQGEEDYDAAATPRTKQAVKALTSQIKDIALKASGAYRNCKPCSRSNNNHSHNYADSDEPDSAHFQCSYRRAGNATPSLRRKGLEGRMKVLSSGETTPASVSGRTESAVFVEEDEPKEWEAQVEPGVLITFVSSPQGGNDLKRIRFSREMFNKWQAQKWWTENYDKVVELYNVQHSNHQAAPLPTPPRSEDEALRNDSPNDGPMTPPLSKECQPGESLDQHPMHSHHPNDSADPASTQKASSMVPVKTETPSVDGSISSKDYSGELSASNASDMETEWVEEDEPGVYITIRALPGGVRELRRVRFSREKFNEMHARLWWEENQARIQEQYL
ncbi:hypothetical protein SAY87_017254 [Trapa incisa]|uniref:BRX domain-containing protein n=1 Tax=Trapa incisa TaxID=236973 RepID=A0AAN7LDT8_9MYRT|nr:hypothetical protein SAY87_017254 [Trapa incisa]